MHNSYTFEIDESDSISEIVKGWLIEKALQVEIEELHFSSNICHGEYLFSITCHIPQNSQGRRKLKNCSVLLSNI